MSVYKSIASEVRALTPSHVANLADCADNNAESTAFLESIRDAWAEAIEYAEGLPDDDARDEIADGAPSVYNHTRMLELVGTAAWSEDLADYAGESGHVDIIGLAGLALYVIAERAVSGLAEEYESRAAELEAEGVR